MIQFEIPYPPTKKGKAAFCKRFGLNAYYAGKPHYGQRTREMQELHTLSAAAMRKAGIRKGLIDCPVEVRFYWDDRMDIDNHAIIGKAIVDSMKGFLLENDGPRYFRRVSHEYWDGGAIMVEVKAWEGGRHGNHNLPKDA